MEDPIAFAATLFRQCAKAVETLSEEDKAALISGEASLRVSVESKTRPRRSPQPTDDTDIIALRTRLDSCQSRDDAERIIEEMSFSKAALRQITKAFELPYTKDDSVSRLVERIVESTVGFRLRSQAIQGKGEPISTTTKEGQQAVQPDTAKGGESSIP